jgi:hypothetical protein
MAATARPEPAKGLTLHPTRWFTGAYGRAGGLSRVEGGTVAMGIPATTRTLGPGAFAILLAASHFSSVRAQEYCVACSAPDALYRCAIDNAAPTGVPLKLLCTRTLAHQGGHATCAVKGGTVFDCDAPIRRIDAAKAAGDLTTPLSAPPEQPRVPGTIPSPTGQDPLMPPPAPLSDVAPAPAKTKPASSPQTVERLAKEVTRASKESLEKAGTTVGGTTRKAWDCIRSLFKSC